MVASMWTEGSLALGLRGVWVSLLSTCGIRLKSDVYSMYLLQHMELTKRGLLDCRLV